MTPDKVRELRKLASTSNYTYRELGKLFGIGAHQASVVARRLQWGDVDD